MEWVTSNEMFLKVFLILLDVRTAHNFSWTLPRSRPQVWARQNLWDSKWDINIKICSKFLEHWYQENVCVPFGSKCVYLVSSTYPKEIWQRDSYDPKNPHACQRQLGKPPGEDGLCRAPGVAEHDEAAESDEGEWEVVDKGDRPPQDGGHDAKRLAERPCPAAAVLYLSRSAPLVW